MNVCIVMLSRHSIEYITFFSVALGLTPTMIPCRRYDTVSDRTDQLHRRLNACLDELSKFRGDSDAFQVHTWRQSVSVGMTAKLGFQ